ncbi:MAG: ECF-type sigma factor [Planctomycetota bacterium]
MANDNEITRFLDEIAEGDPEALRHLLPVVYEDLRRIASTELARERMGHTLQPTALVHEAFLRISQTHTMKWSCREHFFGAAATTMRRVLVDHARAHLALKRGGVNRKRIALESVALYEDGRDVDVLDLDDALTELAKLSSQQAEIVQLLIFAGMKRAQAAEMLGMTTKALTGEWSMARHWLRERLKARGDPS